jgi:hypothetical protein
MCNASSNVQIEELRIGLFRVHWDLEKNMRKECGFFKNKLHLHGSQSGRIYNIIYIFESQHFDALYPYNFGIQLEEISCICDSSVAETNESAAKYQQEAERQKLDDTSFLPTETERKNVPPVRVWFEFEEANTTTGLELEYDKDANHWKVYFFGQRQPFGITLFMDFGTKEMDEKIIINGLEGMFVTQTLCDVHFQFKDGQSVGAHILILSAGSPVFSAMFQSGLLESKSRIVDIDDIEFDVFRQLLIYLYTGMAPKVTEESITQLLFVASDKYGVEALKNKCVNVLKTTENQQRDLNFGLGSLPFHSKALKKSYEICVDKLQ